jgi:hypothetical protein
MNIEELKSMAKGTNFTFTLPGVEPVHLNVDSNDGRVLVGNVTGGLKDGQKIVWSLEGLDRINEINL